MHEDRWVLSKHKTDGKTGKPRVIHLTPRMRRLMGFLRCKSKSNYVFVYCHGKKWTSNAVRLPMQWLRKKLGPG